MKKITGLLIENILRGVYLDKTIIGIGIIINQRDFDPNLPNPTSLSIECLKNFQLIIYYSNYTVVWSVIASDYGKEIFRKFLRSIKNVYLD